MDEKFACYASSAFGLEGLIAEELREMNLSEIKAENGGVRFRASAEELFFCNLKMHFCERIYIIAAEMSAHPLKIFFSWFFRFHGSNIPTGRKHLWFLPNVPEVL